MQLSCDCSVTEKHFARKKVDYFSFRSNNKFSPSKAVRYNLTSVYKHQPSEVDGLNREYLTKIAKMFTAKKNSEIADQLREEGNKLFLAKKYHDSLVRKDTDVLNSMFKKNSCR
jgi:hypothetical protein